MLEQPVPKTAANNGNKMISHNIVLSPESVPKLAFQLKRGQSPPDLPEFWNNLFYKSGGITTYVRLNINTKC
jgi:hypothetical protein